jgi:nucleotide-binding universal stress UspA family protein
METTETKNTIQTAAREAAESARKVGGKLRTLAGSAADSSRRWARRCGDMLSAGGRLATLQTQRRVLQTKLDRAHRDVGRAVHAVYAKEGEANPFAEVPEVRVALEQVREIEEKLHSNGAKVAELRGAGKPGDSAPC